MKFTAGIINSIIDVLLYTSLFTASCAVGLCMATEKLLFVNSIPLITQLHVLIFGSTLLVYNSPRVLKRRSAIGSQPYRFWYRFFFITGLLMTMYGLSWLPVQILIGCIVLGAFSFAYSWPLLPFTNGKRLRDFGWLKILVLAGVWTIATSVLPILSAGKNVSDYPFEILVRFALIFTLCLIFDIRDIQADLQNNIHTLPHKMGERNSYLLINLTLFLFTVLSVLQYLHYPYLGFRLAAALITAGITEVVAYYLRKHPTERGYMGLADGVMLVYAVLVLLPGF